MPHYITFPSPQHLFGHLVSLLSTWTQHQEYVNSLLVYLMWTKRLQPKCDLNKENNGLLCSVLGAPSNLYHGSMHIDLRF